MESTRSSVVTALLTAGIAAALSMPAAGNAATVSVTTERGPSSCNPKQETCPVPPTSYLLYQAAPGEQNTPTFTASGAQIAVSDATAPVTATPGGGCRQTGLSEVVCTLPEPPSAYPAKIDAGDGNDAVTLVGLGAFGTLGAGSDRYTASGRSSIAGGDGDDNISGSPDDDQLDGEGGRDELRGGAGNDALSGGDANAAEADLLDGGAGIDTVAYLRRDTAVAVDLESGTAGAAGERDSVAGFEAVSGGNGPDTLRGTDAADQLDGGAGGDLIEGRGGDDALDGGTGYIGGPPDGNDRIVGGPGKDRLDGRYGADDLNGGEGADSLTGDEGDDSLKGEAGDDVLDGDAQGYLDAGEGGKDRLEGGAGVDTITGGGGADRMSGGAGRDSLSAEDGRSERLVCGRDRDEIADLDPRDRPARDCELVSGGQADVRPNPRVGRGLLVFRLSCPAVREVPRKGCRGVLSASAKLGKRARLVGKRSYRLKRGRSKSLRVSLSRRARARLRSRKSLTVTVRFGSKRAGIRAYTIEVRR